MIQLNPYTISIPFCHGNRYVIPDVHGCVKTLMALIEKIGLQKEDQLFLLGDYIDRGPESVAVINYLIDLQQDDYQVFPIRGNHEHNILMMHQNKMEKLIVKYIYKENTSAFFTSNLDLRKEYFDFFKSLPYFIELEDFFLVHGGFNFESKRPFENTDEMIQIRNWPYRPLPAKNKAIIHGHNPTELHEIQKRIEWNAKIIPLDNGCVFNYMLDMGNLLCLDLESLNLVYQENIDQII